MYIIPWQQSKESRGNSLTISNDDRFRPRSLKCPGNEKQTPTGLTYLRLCSNRPQANQSRWIPYIHYNRPQTGRRAAFDRSPRARRPLTVKSRPARDLAGRDRNLRMRSALLLRVSSLYRSTQSRNRMSITSKFDPHHSPSHHTTSRSRNHFRVMFYDVFGGCEVTKRQSSHLNSHRRPHSAPGRYQAAFDFST